MYILKFIKYNTNKLLHIFLHNLLIIQLNNCRKYSLYNLINNSLIIKILYSIKLQQILNQISIIDSIKSLNKCFE